MEGPHGELTPNRSKDEVQQLKTEIHETQAELQDTVAEIQERLSPSNLKEQAATTVREATVGRVEDMMNRAGDKVEQATDSTRRVANRATRVVSENPMPYALIGIGVAWLIASNRSNQSSMYGDYGRGSYRNRDDYDSTDEYAATTSSAEYSEYGDRSEYGDSNWSESRTASSLPLTDRSRWSGTSSVAHDRGSRMFSGVQDRDWNGMIRNNPMVIAAAAMAAGAVIGAALPTTDIENEYLGETKDSMVESAKSMAQTAAQKITGGALGQDQGSGQGQGQRT